MDQPSFVSAYRTAAILAAFSRASASGEEVRPVRPQAAPTDHHPMGWRWFGTLVDGVIGRISGMSMRCGSGVRALSAGQADVPLPPPRWQVQHLAAAPDHRRPDLTRAFSLSHFRLCDDTDPTDAP